MASRSAEKLETARRLVTTATVAAVDMLDERSVGQFFATVDTVDHLVVTAVADELKHQSPFGSMKTETALRSLDKLWGSFFCARAAVPNLRRGGSITLTSSTAAFRPPSRGGFAFLFAMTNPYVTGALITVDGGISLI